MEALISPPQKKELPPPIEKLLRSPTFWKHQGKAAKWLAIGSIIFFFLLLISTLLLKLLKPTTTQPTQPPIPTIPTTNSISSDPTTNWQTYTNKKYGFSFLYNPDWKIIQLEKGFYFIPTEELKDRLMKLNIFGEDLDKNVYEMTFEEEKYRIVIWDKNILKKLGNFYKNNPEELNAPSYGWHNTDGWDYWFEKFTTKENEFILKDKTTFINRIKKEKNEWLKIESNYKSPGGQITSIKYLTFIIDKMYEIEYQGSCGFPIKEIKNKQDFDDFLTNCKDFSNKSLKEFDEFISSFKFLNQTPNDLSP